MRGVIFLSLIFIALISGIYAQCNSTQIDINSASSENLDKIYGIGAAKAQAIIDYRINHSFSSIDDLVNVKGIGLVTVEKIKQQGLACVNSEENKTIKTIKSSEINNSNNPVQPNETSYTNKPSTTEQTGASNSTGDSTPKTINLNSKNSSGAKEASSPSSILNSGNLALYGLVAFSVFLGILFSAKKLRIKRYKSEFN